MDLVGRGVSVGKKFESIRVLELLRPRKRLAVQVIDLDW